MNTGYYSRNEILRAIMSIYFVDDYAFDVVYHQMCLSSRPVNKDDIEQLLPKEIFSYEDNHDLISRVLESMERFPKVKVF